MVTSFMRVSVRGRKVFSLTGSFSISSKVSRPSITLLKRLNCHSDTCELLFLFFYNKDRTYFPNTVYFMSRWGCLAYVMKNWEPLVLGPLFAIETTPLTLCWVNRWRIITLLMWATNFETSTKLMLTFRCSLNSSSNLRPHILVPPLPEPEQDFF